MAGFQISFTNTQLYVCNMMIIKEPTTP